jgi:hypothetical protein
MKLKEPREERRVTFIGHLHIVQSGFVFMPKCRACDIDMLFARPLNPNLGLKDSLTGCLPYSVLSEQKARIRTSGRFRLGSKTEVAALERHVCSTPPQQTSSGRRAMSVSCRVEV